MDWKQFFAAIVAALAWPAATVTLVMLLRSPLAKLIPMIRSLKYKDLHIDLSEELQAAKVVLDASKSYEKLTPAYAPLPGIIELANIDPRAAVLSAWIYVEKALTDLANKVGVQPKSSNMTLANELFVMDAIDELAFNTLQSLRRIRNDAVQLTTREVTYDEAMEMADMCQWLTHRLKLLTSGFPPAPPTDANA